MLYVHMRRTIILHKKLIVFSSRLYSFACPMVQRIQIQPEYVMYVGHVELLLSIFDCVSCCCRRRCKYY
jgi:hypothetical protein